MKLPIALVTLLLICSSSAVAPAADLYTSADRLAFTRLKSLVGHWDGDTAFGQIRLSYELASDGNVLLEHERIDARHENMVTAYYLENGKLALTHYCEIGNQSRMTAKRIDLSKGEIDFEFAGAGHSASDHISHMQSVIVRLIDADHFSSDWTIFQNAKPSLSVRGRYDRVIDSSLRMELTLLKLWWKLQNSTGWGSQALR